MHSIVNTIGELFEPQLPPLGYTKAIGKEPVVLAYGIGNIIGYASGINTVANWIGYTVSVLTYGIVVSRTVGVVRIVASLFLFLLLVRDDDQKNDVKNSLIGQIGRGMAEFAGLSPILFVGDMAVTIYMNLPSKTPSDGTALSFASSNVVGDT